MTAFERTYNGRAMRSLKRLIDLSRSEAHQETEPLYAYDHKPGQAKWTAIWLGVVFFLCSIASCARPAHAFTDEQYLKAIRHAEGTWTYGIKTVKCDSEEACRKVALRTIHNNRIRFAKYGFRNYPSFTEFLGSRYCPIKSANLSKSEIRLNQYWVKNVSYFLRKEAA